MEIIIDRLKREFKVEAEVGKPQVAYRETITEPVELWYTHEKQTGGSGQYVTWPEQIFLAIGKATPKIDWPSQIHNFGWSNH